MYANRKQLRIMCVLFLTDSVTQDLQENNPLLHDLRSLSQTRELPINSNKK